MAVPVVDIELAPCKAVEEAVLVEIPKARIPRAETYCVWFKVTIGRADDGEGLLA
jgi:hypothetical protein